MEEAASATLRDLVLLHDNDIEMALWTLDRVER